MKQMIIDERNRIEFLVGCGRTIPQTANELGRSPSTIRNELVKHRVDSDKRHGCSNRLCAHFDECVRKVFSGFGERLAKNAPKCFKSCPNFREASCPWLARPPFVCNGCEKERECTLKEKFYIASVAQAQYETELHLSRTGVHPDEETDGGSYRGMFATNFDIDDAEIASEVVAWGRRRWNIESSFNVEKHGGYGLEHVFCNHWRCSRNLYLLMQLAHNLWQVFNLFVLSKVSDGCRKMAQYEWVELLMRMMHEVGIREDFRSVPRRYLRRMDL